MKLIILLTLLFSFHSYSVCYRHGDSKTKVRKVFCWKQIGYDFDGVLYKNSTDWQHEDEAEPGQLLNDDQKFFIQQNNVPIGFEVYQDKVFVTVPRRRYGIPSTLNYVQQGGVMSPLLKPYPDVGSIGKFVSVYRPRVDVCRRLWMVDTGLLEIPGARKQVQPPAIIIYDLNTNTQILRHELDSSVLVNERTPAGLTSITVDVSRYACEDAFAYINDLATEGLVVFSLKDQTSWRVDHPTFKHNEAALNFTSSGQTLNWKDGLFSIALAKRGGGEKFLYYHPLVSTEEFAINTSVLKARGSLDGINPLLGNRGPNTQSGSHDCHSSGVMFFANVAQAGILCWNINNDLRPDNVVLVEKDDDKLGYISDLKVRGDNVWVLSNQIPKFIYNTQNVNDYNYFVMRGSVHRLIQRTKCDSR